MYKEHQDLTPPSPDATLWRYMDFTKFASVLEKQSLFFARANELEDPFEGYLPYLTRAECGIILPIVLTRIPSFKHGLTIQKSVLSLR